MNKIFFTTVIFFALTTNLFAKEIIYLKCPEIVTKNNSKGVLESMGWSALGKEMGRTYAKITILKSSAKIKLHSTLGAYPDKEKPASGGPAQKSKLEDGKYEHNDIWNDDKTSMLDNRYFFKVNNKWELSGVFMNKDKVIQEGVSEKLYGAYTYAGKCEELSKKKYKSILKKGE